MHARLENESTEDFKCHNLMGWLNFVLDGSLTTQPQALFPGSAGELPILMVSNNVLSLCQTLIMLLSVIPRISQHASCRGIPLTDG